MSLARVVRRPTVSAAAAVALMAGVSVAPGAGAAISAPARCTPRVLILGAMPSEIGVVLAATRVDKRITVGDRRFYVGKLAGKNVVLAMTGIGLVNAQQTAAAAFQQFRCRYTRGISAAVFTGVSGGTAKIGDVTVVDRWRSTENAPWLPVDWAMQATARKAAARVKLERRTPTGDPACACVLSPNAVKTVDLGRQPRVIFGGNGGSADPFNGERFFCVPNGGNVFGCEPCREQQRKVSDGPVFVKQLRPFLDPEFFTGFFEAPAPSTTVYAAADMETAAAAQVAKNHKTPFIAFRALSDGKGDPLHLSTDLSGPLPGWLVQFFYYQQLAAENAGRMTIAFLKLWRSR